MGLNTFVEWLQREWPKIAEFLDKLGAAYLHYEFVKQSGWVPHGTLPAHLIEQSNSDPKLFTDLVDAYYEEKWPSVRREIEARVASYPIDDEAMAAFTEALAAHEAGLYRMVPRGLFPEIERVARTELYGGVLGTIPSPDGKYQWQVWHHLIQSAGEKLSLSDMDPHLFNAFRLFEFFSEHIYTQVKSLEDQKRFAADPVPNRHAALHGLVPYRSSKNSLNAIFMAEYLLHVICLLKEARSHDGTEPAV
ncbi:MAG: hypothetical protein ACLP8A_10075 [Methylovirgula sp.]